MTVELARLTAADFEPRVNDAFCITTKESAAILKLVEVRRLGPALRDGGAFSLTFLSPPGPCLPQAIYPLDNAAFGTVEMFLDDRFHEIDHGTSGLFADSSFAIG